MNKYQKIEREMGQQASKPHSSSVSLKLFEYFNELLIATGSGILGLPILIHNGLKNRNYLTTICVLALVSTCLLRLFQSDTYIQPSLNKLVVISGCDSGLGYSLALHMQSIGMQVVAGCLNPHCEGARHLASHNVHVIELNVTSIDSINRAVRHVTNLLDAQKENVLFAVVNNAGVMVFSEFEWQTDKLMFDQINVNLIGCMRMTKGFLPLLRKFRARLINISSHCALESLPGLSVYGASKAGIKGFNDALRVEMRKYGVRVISFIPGSFPTQSNILAKQMHYVLQMRAAFTQEQRDFYAEYFQRYNSYLSGITSPNRVRKLSSPLLYEHFQHALLTQTPRSSYKLEPWRYCIYHLLFRCTPTVLRDRFVEMFVQMPKFEMQDKAVQGNCTSSANSLSLSLQCDDSLKEDDGRNFYGLENIRFQRYEPATLQASNEFETVFRGPSGDDESIASQKYYHN